MYKKKIRIALMFSYAFLFGACLGICETASAQEPSYLIGPNDVLNIYVWKEPELTRDVTVMADGRISFPLIGEVMAQGQTVSQLKETITDRLKKFVTAPEVTVIVNESRSRRVYTIGKVTRPGPFPLEADMTVIQALSNAGGFAEWADTKKIRIIRREGDKEVQLHFNYNEFVEGRNIQQNVVLRPGDTIVVP